MDPVYFEVPWSFLNIDEVKQVIGLAFESGKLDYYRILKNDILVRVPTASGFASLVDLSVDFFGQF